MLHELFITHHTNGTSIMNLSHLSKIALSPSCFPLRFLYDSILQQKEGPTHTNLMTALGSMMNEETLLTK